MLGHNEIFHDFSRRGAISFTSATYLKSSCELITFLQNEEFSKKQPEIS